LGIGDSISNGQFCPVKFLFKVTIPKNHILVQKLAVPTGGLLLVLHLFITLSYTFFLHVHTLDNGEKAIHSHPFTATDADGEAMHQHPGSVFQISPDLKNYLETPSNNEIFTLDKTMSVFQMPVIYHLEFRKCSRLLRGPPVFI
jgi:hypothetical protein